MDITTLAAAKKYTEDSLKGAGALKGQDGLTPFINDKGNWQIGTQDTGIKASGEGYNLTYEDKNEIAQQAAHLIDLQLLDLIGPGVVK